MNLNTSPRITQIAGSLSFVITDFMKFAWVAAISTATTRLQPRERNSRLIAPVPAKRSRVLLPSRSNEFSMTLNMFSRAKSVVGRAVIFFGTSNRRRPYFPLIILIL